MSSPDFTQLPLHRSLLKNLSTLRFHTMTPIQAKTLPVILEGNDVIGKAKTGSGKTAAFGLGLLNQLNVKHFAIQSLVLCPTRELADQVATELRKFARQLHNVKILTLCGGAPIGPQIGSLAHGAHIVVGTPGRIEDHLRKKTLSLATVRCLVLDEADRMLDMGFKDAIDNIVEQVPQNRQTLLFSATYPPEINKIAEAIMSDPLFVEDEGIHNETSIKQHFICLNERQTRIDVMRHILLKQRPESAMVFCNTKRECNDITEQLNHYSFEAIALHGDLDQKDREQTLVRFSNRSVSLLVATDVAARGLDIDAVDCVINFQLAKDQEQHIHRVGRTGRAGKSGLAYSLVAEDELFKLERLERFLGETLARETFNLLELDQQPYASNTSTLQIQAGKKQKLRPGDVVGALASGGEISADDVGKINVMDYCTYVAIKRTSAALALKKLIAGKIKGRTFRVRKIGK